jgi:small subunit ribosomal protein S7
MPRRGIRKKIEKKYDSYEQMVVEKTINKLMWEGKKSVARNIFESAIAEVRERTGEDGLTMFRKAIEALKPELEVKSRRVGGANYQVPIPVRPDRKLSLAIRWLVNYARDRKDEYAMSKRLAKEIIDAVNGQGGAAKKKDDTHKMAEANKAFAHFRY